MVQQPGFRSMVYYYLDKTKKENKMTDPLKNYGSPKMGGSPFNTDNNDPALNTATVGVATPITAPVTGTNIDPVLAIAASALTFAGGIVVAKGWLDATSWATISGAILAIAGASYVAYQNKTSSKINSLATTLNVPKAAFKRHIMSMKRGTNV